MPSFFEWRYVIETSKDGKNWTYQDSPYEDQEQAIAACKELKVPNKRVRSFKVTVFKDAVELEATTVHNNDTTKQLVPFVPWFCITHPTETVSALETSSPRCPTCHQTMFQGDPADL